YLSRDEYILAFRELGKLSGFHGYGLFFRVIAGQAHTPGIEHDLRLSPPVQDIEGGAEYFYIDILGVNLELLRFRRFRNLKKCFPLQPYFAVPVASPSGCVAKRRGGSQQYY